MSHINSKSLKILVKDIKISKNHNSMDTFSLIYSCGKHKIISHYPFDDIINLSID
jgi:hypothetical protein